MAPQEGYRDVVRFLHCASVLEDKIFGLYKSLSDRINHSTVKSLLLYVAYDSLKLSAILGKISESTASGETTLANCERELGDIWKFVETFSEELARRHNVDDEELPKLVETLFVFMQTRHSRVMTRLKTIQLMGKEICEACDLDSGNLERIIEMMVRDEENQREIITTMHDHYVKKEQERAAEEKAKDNTPLVKYQTPDAWYRH